MREELLAKCISALRQQGFAVSTFFHSNTCFDLAAKKEDLCLLVKVLENIDSLRKESAEELKRLSAVFTAVALIVGEKTKAFRLKSGMIYERHGIPVLTVRDFGDIFSKEIPNIKYFKGKELVEIDAEKLREKRKQLNLSLEELAQKIHSSPESLYRYEHGFGSSLQTAKRLEKTLKERLVKEKQLLAPAHIDEKELFESEFQDSALEKMHDIGLRIAIFEHAPFKAYTSASNSQILVSRGKTKQELQKKALVLEKTRTVFDAHSMIIAKEFKYKSIESTPVIEEEELSTLSKPKDLLKMLKEREK